MVGFKRTERVSDQIRMEIADILMRRVKDPRVGFVTVTAVDVTADLKQAWVYVTVLQQGAQEAETLDALARAEGFIKSELGRRLKLRYVPGIKFVKDTSIDRVTRVLNLLDEVRPKQAESRDENAGRKDRGQA
ncbi:MAG TPA: 30S ribosome-binding factor RbfA [Nitrospirales bacterium]|jgi:ribosome-binding factor A|nr:30S ribosome-binding factor RbfA [Nitrospirales bacterium]